MNILAALKREEAKLQKQANKARQQLDAVRSARKILGREVAIIAAVNGLARRNG